MTNDKSAGRRLRQAWEKQTIAGFHLENTPEGYRLTVMMVDADTAAVAPRACGPYLAKPDSCRSGAASRRRRARASCSHWPPISTGTSAPPRKWRFEPAPSSTQANPVHGDDVEEGVSNRSKTPAQILCELFRTEGRDNL